MLAEREDFVVTVTDRQVDVKGRFCKSEGSISCCLPCPMTDWTYPDNFNYLTSIASWINVAGMTCCVFLLLSWACLPVEKTHRHYLSVCLVCAIVLMNVSEMSVDNDQLIPARS